MTCPDPMLGDSPDCASARVGFSSTLGSRRAVSRPLSEIIYGCICSGPALAEDPNPPGPNPPCTSRKPAVWPARPHTLVTNICNARDQSQVDCYQIIVDMNTISVRKGDAFFWSTGLVTRFFHTLRI